MKTFNDNAGRTWTVAINVDTVKRVKSLLSVNLMEVIEGRKDDPESLLGRLSSDPVLLCDVIYAVCKPEADAKGVTDEDFGRAMAGDAIDMGTQALLEELCDFFPQGRRKLLRKALEKLRRLETLALNAAETKLDDPALESRLLRELSDTIDSAGNLAESSASPPAATPSAS